MKQLGIRLLTLALAFISISTGQVSTQSKQALPPTKAPNAWMKIPSSPDRDPVSTFTRQYRDLFWDSSGIAHKVALTPESAGRAASSDGDGNVNGPEIRDFPNRAVLLGTFLSYHSILTASGRTIYTDGIFRVHHIFQDHGHAAINSDITVSMPGGTVMGALGQPISYLTQPRSLSLQPTRTYLLLLSYHADGDFYTHVDDWDISDGIARPNTKISQAKAKEGTSISGLTTDALDRTLSQRLSEKR